MLVALPAEATLNPAPPVAVAETVPDPVRFVALVEFVGVNAAPPVVVADTVPDPTTLVAFTAEATLSPEPPVVVEDIAPDPLNPTAVPPIFKADAVPVKLVPGPEKLPADTVPVAVIALVIRLLVIEVKPDWIDKNSALNGAEAISAP